MAGKKIELGTTGRTIAENIAAIRSRQNLTWTDVSRRLKERGRDIPAVGIKRIELMERRVDVDDLVAIAAALEISPSTLLMPRADDATAEVTATGMTPTTALELWQWITAAAGRPPGSDAKVDLDWMHRALPPWTFRQLTNDEMRDALLAPARAEHERRTRDRGND